MNGVDLKEMERTSSDELNEMERMEKKATVLLRTETSLSLTDDDECSSSNDSSTSSVFLEVLDANCPEAEELRRRNASLLEIPVEQQKTYIVETDKRDKTHQTINVEVDLEKYMSSREMTPFQERMNALTMIPAPVFCFVYILSGNWMSKTLVAEAAMRNLVDQDPDMTATFQDSNACIDWSSLPMVGWILGNLHALPPLSVLTIMLGIVAHAPFSFLYHWKYAHTLSPSERTNHWSRRMDQSMLHVQSCLSAYATSGHVDFFLVNAIFNIDCIYRQFEPLVRPRRNQGRLGVAIVAWTIPILRRGDFEMFAQVIFLLATGIYLFIRYPIGGWSHAAFHLVLLPLMPLLMQIAVGLDSSQDELYGAARCYALAEHPAM